MRLVLPYAGTFASFVRCRLLPLLLFPALASLPLPLATHLPWRAQCCWMEAAAVLVFRLPYTLSICDVRLRHRPACAFMSVQLESQLNSLEFAAGQPRAGTE